LTAPHPIKPTSTNCHSAWQPNPGRDSTYRSGKSVQTTGTTSEHLRSLWRCCFILSYKGHLAFHRGYTGYFIVGASWYGLPTLKLTK
jgi:hypothetical protein